MAQKLKITYATLSADNEELQSAFDDAIAKVNSEWPGAEVPMFIKGKKVHSTPKRGDDYLGKKMYYLGLTFSMTSIGK